MMFNKTMGTILITCLLCLSIHTENFAQFFSKDEHWKSVEIPFKFHNDFIIIELMFNKVFPLKFIFDTGAEHTILTKREYADILGIPSRKRFSVMGADMQTVIYAHLATGVHLKISNLVSPRHNILILEEDYFKFQEIIGMDIHGILGADLFRNFVVKIDYNKHLLTFTKPQHFKKPSKKYQVCPIEIRKQKPYLYTELQLQGGQKMNLKLLIDTGASINLLLNTTTHPSLKLPENVILGNIGTGLGGFIEGFIGRVQSIKFADFELQNVITNFQKSVTYVDSTILKQRNGIIGNALLKRFSVIINYQKQRLYLKGLRKLKKKFKYDRSGIIFIAAGPNLNTLIVNNIIADSPADKAGIKKGDVLKKLNNIPIAFLSLRNVNSFMQKRVGKNIKLGLVRDGKKITKHFKLKALI